MGYRIRASALPAVAIALLAATAVCQSASAETRPPRTVLAIHWGAEDFPGTPVLNAAIREALESHYDSPINYFAEYLESEAFPSSSLPLRDYIRQKYQGRRIDLVIANTSPSLDFAVSYRRELFPNAPIVFLAGAVPDVITNHSVSGITGVVSDVSFAETLELALKLHPSARRVFVVAQAPTQESYRERVQDALRRFSQQLDLTYLNERSVPGLLSAIKAIPRGSLILYTRFTPDDVESVADTVEVARLMAEVAPVPIYGTTALYMGTGVVGGVMRDSRETGLRIGQIANQILNGRRPVDLPVEKVQRRPTFDWRQVRRWGIDPSGLPPGSEIHFRTATAWETYRWYVIGTIAVVVTLLLLIVGLLTQRARRRRAEETIRKREATLRKSFERIQHLAGRLINAQEAARASIAQDLHDDVCQRLVYVSMAVNSLKSSSGGIQDASTQQAFAELERDTMGVFDGLRRLSHELHPATLRVLGLAPALKAHCIEVEKRHGVRVSFESDGDLGRLHPDVAACFFRIAQESLRNGRVHGEARQFTVSLGKSGPHIEMSVSDDGSGFDLEAVRRDGKGLGLMSMEERAHVIDAEVQIVTAPRRGTRIRVRGPAEPPHLVPLAVAGQPAETAPAVQSPVVR
jgi:signal transduction histidine kinase